MKYLTLIFSLLLFSHFSQAQIEVDSAYTVMVGTHQGDSALPFLLASPDRIVVKENATGKTCPLASPSYKVFIDAIIFKATNTEELKELLKRSKPKDIIYIENIHLGSTCFKAPKQIIVRIM